MPEPRKVRQTKPEKKTHRLKKSSGKSTNKIKGIGGFLKREINLPLPDNKVGKSLGKKGRLVPSFLINAWSEVRQVNWPNRKETTKLTFAVLVFTFGIGLAIAGVDFVLEKIFKEVILP